MKKISFKLPKVHPVQVGPLELTDKQLFLIAGPCVIEERKIVIEIAQRAKEITSELGIPYIFKASFDKANRTSAETERGPQIESGLKTLKYCKEKVGVPILTDIHERSQAVKVAEVVDCIQIPAFLCRQTDLLHAAGKTGKAVNIKKGQFLSPEMMKHAANKVAFKGNRNILLTERGVTFGYGNLIVDMRSIPMMRETGYPVVFDATHSVQLPGGKGTSSGGQREFIFTLAKSAIAAGASGLFLEIHPNPDQAKSDRFNTFPLDNLKEFLERILLVYSSIRKT
jgi:2-dehydro-3-deoxyphosphooctonate aldolase (KDO 8-P synthase)